MLREENYNFPLAVNISDMWEGGREAVSVSHSESLDLSILHPGQQNFLNISQEAHSQAG